MLLIKVDVIYYVRLKSDFHERLLRSERSKMFTIFYRGMRNDYISLNPKLIFLPLFGVSCFWFYEISLLFGFGLVGSTFSVRFFNGFVSSYSFC